MANTGPRAGKAAPQVYLTGAGGKPLQRLIGFDKLDLKPGETRRVTLAADARLLGRFDVKTNRWIIDKGGYQIAVGAASDDLALKGGADLKAATLKP